MSFRPLSQYVFCFSFLVVSNYASAQFTFNEGAEITGCILECPNDLDIPNQIGGNDVFRIGFEAFRDIELSSVTIPASILGIGHSAFADNELTKVIIPDSVTNIEDGAFDGNQITNLSIGNSVFNIGRFSFMDNQLTTVSIPNSVLIVENHAFRENLLQNVSFGDNVEIIGEEAFRDNQLSTVDIPDSVVKIGHRAFMNNQFASLVIPYNVESIGDYAFYNDYLNRNRFQLDIVHFKGNRPTIGIGAFSSENPNFSLNRVTYCPNTSGWPGSPIEGITPELDPLCVTPTVTPVTPVNPSNCLVQTQMGYSTFDIDQNGSVDALSDGLMLIRYFFGIRGQDLVAGVVASNANRSSVAEIEAYIESHMP
jgi:hypothetical protein